MKRLISLLSFVLVIVLLIGSLPVCAATLGTFPQVPSSLLDESRILEGADNITVHEDGSWTATGPFTLAVDVCYDYEVYSYYPTLLMETDTVFDLQTTMRVTPTASYTVDLYTELYGMPLDDTYNHQFLTLSGLAGLYAWNVRQGVWAEDAYTLVDIVTITYAPVTDGTTTFYALGFDSGIGGFSLGDINHDFAIDMQDAMQLYRVVSGREHTDLTLAFLDMDDNNTVSIVDALTLYRHAAGLA